MEVKAPNYNYKLSNYRKSIFLAGAIDNGAAEEWQKELVSTLKNKEIIFFNPRRDNWDINLKPVAENEVFKSQVEWELAHIDLADYVVFYFPEHAKAPISFLELGLCLAQKPNHTIIFCHDKFYRKGNIDITAELFGSTVFSDKSIFIEHLKRILE